MNSLSKYQIEEFKTTGALLVRNIIPKNLIYEVIEDIEERFQKATGYKTNYQEIVKRLDKNDPKKLYQIHLATSKREIFIKIENCLSEVLKELLNSNHYQLVSNSAGYLINLSKDKRLIYDWHQECNYMKTIRPIISANYPLLRKTSPQNGALSYLSKSCSLGELKFKKELKQNGYTSLIPENIEEIKKNFNEVQPSLELGDCLFFDEYCIHKSNYNNTEEPSTCGLFRFTSQNNAKSYRQLTPEEL